MYGSKELREHLQKQLGISDRHLRRLIAEKAADLPSTKEQALFVLAHENRMRLQNYMTPEQIADVRGVLQGRPATARSPVRNNGGGSVRRAPTPRTVAMTIGTEQYGAIPGLKSSHETRRRLWRSVSTRSCTSSRTRCAT